MKVQSLHSAVPDGDALVQHAGHSVDDGAPDVVLRLIGLHDDIAVQ